MTLGLMGSFASVAGLVIATIVAVLQYRAATRSASVAAAERAKARKLEDYLAQRQWHQLRSLGEQVDALERDGRYLRDASAAAIHAQLIEQYKSLLGVVTTSTPGYCAATIRRWVKLGRFPRPWQLAEAIRHIDPHTEGALAGDHDDDLEYLHTLMGEASGGLVPRKLISPPPLTEYVAAYILVGASVREELRGFLSQGGQSAASAACLLRYLAKDCLELSRDHMGRRYFAAWGHSAKQSFSERAEFYQGQDFWVVTEAARYARAHLEGHEHRFLSVLEHGDDLLIPTEDAVEQARIEFPLLPDAVSSLFSAKG